ncbi:hypothetical protein D3C79_676310 [compost metagenome]
MTEHHLDQLQPWQVVGRLGAHQLTVAQHSNAIADAVNLIEEMSDKDHAYPLRSQLTENIQQHGDFFSIQAGSGFIQDQDFG